MDASGVLEMAPRPLFFTGDILIVCYTVSIKQYTAVESWTHDLIKIRNIMGSRRAPWGSCNKHPGDDSRTNPGLQLIRPGFLVRGGA